MWATRNCKFCRNCGYYIDGVSLHNIVSYKICLWFYCIVLMHLVKIVNYSILKHYTNLTVQNKYNCFDLFVYHDTWDEHIMGMQFMSTITQPFWFRGHKLFGTCMLHSTLNSIMGVIYVGYFDNEINMTFLQLRLDVISDLLKTFFLISGHTSLATTNKQHPTTSDAVIDHPALQLALYCLKLQILIYLCMYVCIYQVQNVFLRCLTPRLHCFLSSHWSSFRFLSFMAFLIPSIHFFLGFPHALICFGIHFNAILGSLSSAIL